MPITIEPAAVGRAWFAGAAALVSCAALAQAPDPNLARNLAATCANCHGTTGRGQANIPALAGQSKSDLVAKMNDFRGDKRQASIMHQLAKGYTPEQIDLIAGWYSQQASR